MASTRTRIPLEYVSGHLYYVLLIVVAASVQRVPRRVHSNYRRWVLRYAPHPFSDYSGVVAMKILDPHLKDGVHEWRDGKRFVKEGAKLYLEGTDTLAGRCVPNHPRPHLC